MAFFPEILASAADLWLWFLTFDKQLPLPFLSHLLVRVWHVTTQTIFFPSKAILLRATFLGLGPLDPCTAGIFCVSAGVRSIPS